LLSAQFLPEPPADLGDFDCVLLAGVEDAAFTSSDNLRNSGEPMKG
jgi:hypothetical protein